MVRSVAPAPSAQETFAPRLSADMRMPTFLHTGSNQAVRFSAIESLSNASARAAFRLTSGHLFMGMESWSLIYSAIFPHERMLFAGKRRPMPEQGVVLSVGILPTRPEATHLTIVGAVGGDEITVSLEHVLAYGPRNGKMVLHMSGGQEVMLNLEHTHEVVSAFTAAYGSPGVVTRASSSSSDDAAYRWDPSHEISNRYAVNLGQY